MEKLFIPKKIRVGYQEREDTYTKRLAYIIYYDAKGKLRKEESWTNWSWLEDVWQERSIFNNETQSYEMTDDGKRYKTKPTLVRKNLGFNEFDNVPTEGFVLNKGVGGQRESWGWNARNEYIRVFDPRGFEFEISVANLLYILQECTSTKGKGLEGNFVYAWDGKDLMLLPEGTYEYNMSADFTSSQNKKMDKSEMVIGYTYQFKDMKNAVYLGRKEFNFFGLMKAHIFYDISSKSFFYTTGFTKIAKVIDTDEPDNFVELIDEWQKRPNHNMIKALEFKKLDFNIEDLKNNKHLSFNRESKLSRYPQWQTYYKTNILALKGTNDYRATSLEKTILHYSISQPWVDQYDWKINFRIENFKIVWDEKEYKQASYYSRADDIDTRIHTKHNYNDIEDVLKLFDHYEMNVVLLDGTVMGYDEYNTAMNLNKK